MNSELVHAWLKKRLRRARMGKLAGMASSLLVGLLILFVSFWVCYGVIWFVSRAVFPLQHSIILLIAGAFIALVVVVGARQSWDTIDPLPRQETLARDMDITLTPWTRYGMAYDTNVIKAGVFKVRAQAMIINGILCSGAILLVGSLGKLRQFRRLKTIDTRGCAQVIALLQGMPGRQSFTDIVQKLPGLDPVKVFDDLRYIEGVLFLSSEPSGLTLNPELRSELERLA